MQIRKLMTSSVLYPKKYITWCISSSCYGSTLGSRSLFLQNENPCFSSFSSLLRIQNLYRRSSAMRTLFMFGIGRCISPYRVTSGKRTGAKSVAIATSKYAPCIVCLRLYYYCQVLIALIYHFQGYSSFCVLAPYWNNL